MTNSNKGRIGSLLLFIICIIIFAVFGGFQNENIKALSLGIASSALVVLVFSFFTDNSSQIANKVVENIQSELFPVGKNHFHHVDRNTDQEENYYVELIRDLSDVKQSVWLLGTRLKRWRLGGTTYNHEFCEKMKTRISHLFTNPAASTYPTYIMLTDGVAKTEWDALILSWVTEVMNRLGGHPNPALATSKIIVKIIPRERVHYSGLLCGNSLSITPYTSTGQVLNCPCMTIRKESPLWELYKEDFALLSRLP